MSEEVIEAIEETQSEPQIEETQPQVKDGIDIDAASAQIAEGLFGKSEPIEEEIEGEVEEEIKEEIKEEAESEEPEVESRQAPDSWKKEKRELFSKADPELQDYIELREEQMKNGIDVRKEDADLGMKMRDAISPYSQLLKSQGIDEIEATKRLMNAHAVLATSPIEQRKQYFDQLAQSYGITQETEEGDIDPKLGQLQEQVRQLTMKLQAQEHASLQDREEKVSRTVQEFASEHSHFDDLSDEIAKLIRADYTLEEAYKVAYRASDFFEKDLKEENKKKSEADKEAKKKEAEKAKKAKSVNVRTRDTGKTPTGPLGTMEDTMKETFRQIQNRT